MARLPEELKTFIVMELACRRAPADVVERVGEEFGIKIKRQQVHEYNPKRVHGKQLAKKWRALFDETRAAFDKDRSNISIAQANFRLRELEDALIRAKARRNDVLVLQILEQAAKEVGGSYSNRREFTGKDGRDLPAGVPSAVIILPAKGDDGDQARDSETPCNERNSHGL